MTDFASRVRSYEFLSLDEVIVIGGGIVDQLGLRVTNDVDLLISRETFEQLKDESTLTLRVRGKDKALVGDGIEIWTDWCRVGDKLWDYDYLSQFTTTINGVRFVAPDKVLQWKRYMGRRKDERDIKLLEEYLYGRVG